MLIDIFLKQTDKLNPKMPILKISITSNCIARCASDLPVSNAQTETQTNDKFAFDAEMVRKVANLTKIGVDDENLNTLAADLESIVGWVQQLDEVDTDGVEPIFHPNAHVSARREDITVQPCRESILNNASDTIEGFYTVPKVVE